MSSWSGVLLRLSCGSCRATEWWHWYAGVGGGAVRCGAAWWRYEATDKLVSFTGKQSLPLSGGDK